MKHLDLFGILVLAAMFAYGALVAVAVFPELFSLPLFDVTVRLAALIFYWGLVAFLACDQYMKYNDPYRF